MRLSAARTALSETPFLLLDAPGRDTDRHRRSARGGGCDPVQRVLGRDRPARGGLPREPAAYRAPSLAMRTDALAQFLVDRRWEDLVLVAGTYPEDIAYAQAPARLAGDKFGLETRGREKHGPSTADMRRNASQEVPLFTQDFGDYDALIVADELGDFARYLLYNTWAARPVLGGSEGLSAVAWSPVVEQWGARQLQNRFAETYGRPMASKDYAAWAAIRSIGEAVTRTRRR